MALFVGLNGNYIAIAECWKLGWTFEQQYLCSEVSSHKIWITKPPGPFWVMTWSVCVVLHKKNDSTNRNFTVQTILFRSPSFKSTLSIFGHLAVTTKCADRMLSHVLLRFSRITMSILTRRSRRKSSWMRTTSPRWGSTWGRGSTWRSSSTTSTRMARGRYFSILYFG